MLLPRNVHRVQAQIVAADGVEDDVEVDLQLVIKAPESVKIL